MPQHPQNTDVKDPVRKFYDRLQESESVKGLPEFGRFSEAMQDSEKRRGFYDRLKTSNSVQGLPDEYERFERLFKKEQPSAGLPTPVERPAEAVTSTTGVARPVIDPPDEPQREGIFGIPAGPQSQVVPQRDGQTDWQEVREQVQQLKSGDHDLDPEVAQNRMGFLENQITDAVAPLFQEKLELERRLMAGTGGTLTDKHTLQTELTRARRGATDTGENIQERINEIDEQINKMKPEGVAPRVMNAAMSALKGAGGQAAAGIEGLGAMAKLIERIAPDGLQGAESAGAVAEEVAEIIRAKSEELFPTDPTLQEEFLSSVLPAATGSFAGFGAGTLAARAARIPAVVAGTGMAASAGAGQTYREAKESGASEDDALTAAAWGFIPGAIQVIPVLRLLDRYDRASGGRLKPGIQRLIEAGKTGSQEAIAESVGQMGFNEIARQIYDQERGLLEGTGTSGAAGFGAGALVDLIVTAAFGNTPRTGSTARQGAVGEVPTIPRANVEGEAFPLQPEARFTWNDEAPPQQQIEQLNAEEQRLRQDIERAEAEGLQTDDLKGALQELDRVRSEVSGQEQSETDQDVQGDADDPDVDPPSGTTRTGAAPGTTPDVNEVNTLTQGDAVRVTVGRADLEGSIESIDDKGTATVRLPSGKTVRRVSENLTRIESAIEESQQPAALNPDISQTGVAQSSSQQAQSLQQVFPEGFREQENQNTGRRTLQGQNEDGFWFTAEENEDGSFEVMAGRQSRDPGGIDQTGTFVNQRMAGENLAGQIEQAVEANRLQENERVEVGPETRIVTRQRYEQAREELLNRISGRLGAGLDPQTLRLSAEIAVYHIESGARHFSDFSQRMVQDLGEKIRPHLADIYNKLRYDPQMASFVNDMSTRDEVTALAEFQSDQQVLTGRRGDEPVYITPYKAQDDLSEGGFDSLNDSVLDTIRLSLQDRFIDLKRFQQRSEGRSGPLDDTANAYMEEELFTGQVEYHIEKFKANFEDPVLMKINDMGWTIEQAEDYLMARHAAERNAQIEKINPERAEGGSGMTDAEAQSILDDTHNSEHGQQARELGRLWDEMVAFQRELLLDSGLAKPETIQAWEDIYKHYISLKGIREDSGRPQAGKGFDLAGRFKRATGRTTRADNAIANTLAQIRADIVRAQKAQVGQALLRFVTDNPNPNDWTVDKVQYRPTISRETGLVEYRPDPRYKLSDNVLNVKVDGENHHITFHSERGKRLARSLKNLGPENAGVIVRGLHSINRYLALINTGLNPDFIVSNFARDIQTAAVNISSTEASNMRGRVLKDVFKARRGMADYLAGRLDTDWARHAEQFVKSGAKTGWIDAYNDLDSFQQELDKRIKSLGRGKGDPRQLIKTAFDYIQRQNDAVENGVRLSLYVHAKNQGISDKKAASIAKNLTVNFNRRGTQGVALNAMYLFYGASVQGSVRIFQAARSKKGRRLMGGLTTWAVLHDMTNRMVGGEDEDDGIPYYDKIPQWIKERNLIIMLPGTEGKYFTIPSPYGYNVLNVAGMEIGKAITHSAMDTPVEYSPGSSAVNIVSAFMDSFNPVGGGGSVLQTIALTFLDPFVQTGQNIDWTGQPIKPPDNPFDLTPTPQSQQFYSSAPEWAKKAAEEVNQLTGGSPARPGLVDVSPEYLEHWFRFVTGGAGNFLDESTDATVKAIRGEQIEPYRVPFAGKLYGRVNEYSDQQKYMEYLKQVQYAEADLKDALARGDKGRAEKIRGDEQVWLGNVKAAKATERNIRKLRERRRKVEQSQLSYEEKKKNVDEINERIYQLQKQLIKSVTDAMSEGDSNP